MNIHGKLMEKFRQRIIVNVACIYFYFFIIICGNNITTYRITERQNNNARNKNENVQRDIRNSYKIILIRTGNIISVLRVLILNGIIINLNKRVIKLSKFYLPAEHVVNQLNTLIPVGIIIFPGSEQARV